MVETGSGVVVHAPVPSRPLADRAPEPSAARARIIDATGTALLAVVRSKIIACHVVDGSETATTALARVGKVAPERLHQRLTIALSLASSTRGLLLFCELVFRGLEAFRKNSILRLPHSTRNSLLRLRKDAVFDGPVLCRAVRLKYCRREAPCKRPVGIVRAAATRSTVTCTPNAPAALAMGGEPVVILAYYLEFASDVPR